MALSPAAVPAHHQINTQQQQPMVIPSQHNNDRPTPLACVVFSCPVFIIALLVHQQEKKKNVLLAQHTQELPERRPDRPDRQTDRQTDPATPHLLSPASPAYLPRLPAPALSSSRSAVHPPPAAASCSARSARRQRARRRPHTTDAPQRSHPAHPRTAAADATDDGRDRAATSPHDKQEQ